MSQLPVVLLVLALALPSPAHAYLDPASGNALGALVVALFTYLAFFFHVACYRLNALLSGNDLTERPALKEGSAPKMRKIKPNLRATI